MACCGSTALEREVCLTGVLDTMTNLRQPNGDFEYCNVDLARRASKEVCERHYLGEVRAIRCGCYGMRGRRCRWNAEAEACVLEKDSSGVPLEFECGYLPPPLPPYTPMPPMILRELSLAIPPPQCHRRTNVFHLQHIASYKNTLP